MISLVEKQIVLAPSYFLSHLLMCESNSLGGQSRERGGYLSYVWCYRGDIQDQTVWAFIFL